MYIIPSKSYMFPGRVAVDPYITHNPYTICTDLYIFRQKNHLLREPGMVAVDTLYYTIRTDLYIFRQKITYLRSQAKLLWIHTLSWCLSTSPAHLCKIVIFKKMWMQIWMIGMNMLSMTKMTPTDKDKDKDKYKDTDKFKDKDDTTHQLRGERERMGRQVQASGQE